MIVFLLLLIQLIALFFLSHQTSNQIFYFLRLFIDDEKTIFIIVSLLFLPGTIIHELAHFFAAIILFTNILIRQWKNRARHPWLARDYQLELLGETNDLDLEDYEKEFLEVIFDGKKTITTKDLLRRARNPSVPFEKRLWFQMLKLRDKLYQETAHDTQAYAIGFKEPGAGKSVLKVIGLAVLSSVLIAQISPVLVIVVVCFLVIYFLRFDPRLNQSGVRLKQDWLGFILYLKTAEKYRLQNLTPDLFEKFLPYAIIFGVEKQWGRAFDSFNLPEPNWYHGAGAVAGGSSFSGSGGGFSASAFSASFASSFSSAFSSSSGGGASGGGGGAGGGGGGGGGGAS